MRQVYSRSKLGLATAMAIGLTVLQVSVAQAGPKVTTGVIAHKCSNAGDGIAYETSAEFIAWLLASPERMRSVGDAELRAIFTEFAERQAWRKAIATKG